MQICFNLEQFSIFEQRDNIGYYRGDDYRSMCAGALYRFALMRFRLRLESTGIYLVAIRRVLSVLINL